MYSNLRITLTCICDFVFQIKYLRLLFVVLSPPSFYFIILFLLFIKKNEDCWTTGRGEKRFFFFFFFFGFFFTRLLPGWHQAQYKYNINSTLPGTVIPTRDQRDNNQ